MSETDIIIAAIQALGYMEDRNLSSCRTDYYIIAFKPGPRLSPLAPEFELHCDHTGADSTYRIVDGSMMYPAVDCLAVFQQLLGFKKRHNL